MAFLTIPFLQSMHFFDINQSVVCEHNCIEWYNVSFQLQCKYTKLNAHNKKNAAYYSDRLPFVDSNQRW